MMAIQRLRGHLVKAATMSSMGLVIASGGVLFHNPRPSDAPSQSIPKTIPQSFDLGTVLRGTLSEHQLSINNPTSESIPFAKLSTSCPCLELACPTNAIAANKSVNLRAKLDLRPDPDFVGDLAIEISEKNAEGIPIPLALVKVSVLREKGLIRDKRTQAQKHAKATDTGGVNDESR
jgi:hypothetical protein